MKRVLLRSKAFVRAAKRLVKKQSDAAEDLRKALEMLEADAFQSELKTHKLKGDWAGSWSCSVGYDLRIVSELVQHDGAEAVHLQTMGTHDEVY